MKFEEFEYIRPDYEEDRKKAEHLLNGMKDSKDAASFLTLFAEMNELRNHIETMSTLCSIRNSINTADEFYDKENDYWDEIGPQYQVLSSDLYKAVLASPFLAELKKEIPETFFMTAENSMKSFDEKIIPLLQQENKLSSQYSKLIAKAEIEFEGETYNLSQLQAKALSNDRDQRKKAYDARMSYFQANEAKFDRIYDELVNLRDKIARELGFNNYVELGYIRMNRFDYDENQVEVFRNAVLKYLVPAASELYERQKNRLGLESLRYFDEKFEFLSGNPKPHGSYEKLIQAALSMYKELSPETGAFFQMMVDQDLLDLVSKKNKQGGGYCTSIADYHVPFIFSNFNGTSGDVDVLTHEAGHAFQNYMSRNIPVPECVWPTYESAEIHSMSMEFIAWPWMKSFFKEETEKYYYLHLGSALKFIPYGVLVDHFQHEVYHNPDMTPDQRKETWRKLEKQYLPHKNYEGMDILEKGAWWFQQGHIFASPFYYIDYTLAQLCALQFWKRRMDQDENAWKDYLHLCSLGGTKTFLGLLKAANLKTPFDETTIRDVVASCQNYLGSVDDTKL